MDGLFWAIVEWINVNPYKNVEYFEIQRALRRSVSS